MLGDAGIEVGGDSNVTFSRGVLENIDLKGEVSNVRL